MNFKAQVERDLTAVFHNAREHADVMEFWIDGVRYKGPVIIDDGGAQDRKKPSTDHVDGLVLVDLVVYTTLTFDFEKMTGRDMVSIETEMQMNNEYCLAPEVSRSFQAKMAAKAAGIGSDVLDAMPILTIWATLGAAYVVFETLFRGYSHPSMFVVGGLCGVLVGTINQAPRFYRAPVIVQSVIGAVIVLAVEFVSGCVLNLWLGLGVWDYSNQPGNVLGQICPAFGLLWFFIMPLAIWAEDTTRYLIWAYDCAVYHSQEAPPTIAPYSLKSVYGDFICGR